MAAPPLALEVCVITSRDLVPGRGHLDVAREAARGGAGAIQLRAPELGDERLLPLAEAIAAICARADVLFIVNDRVDVAVASGADGVHLGQRDDPLRARERLGEGRILGISVGSPEQAERAVLAGADYVGVTVWPTPTKPDADPVGLTGMREISSATPLFVAGVGGIDAANAPDVIRAGANGVAVVSAVGAAADPANATRTLCEAVRGAAGSNEVGT